MRWCTIALLGAALSTQAQVNGLNALNAIADAEARGHASLRVQFGERPPYGYDVRYYRLEWNIDPGVRAIDGVVTTWFVAEQPLSVLRFDLSDSLGIYAVEHHGQPVVYTHRTGGDTVHIELPQVLHTGELDSVTVRYYGVPPETGFGSFVQSTHDGAPIIWTLSEPYGAQDWWPCKQDLFDKADSVDAFTTVPIGQRAAGNGTLASVEEHDATVTYHWRERYPIAHYLIATAVTNYAAYDEVCPLPGGDVLITNYVYPEHLAEAQVLTAQQIAVMQLYSTLFGRYPFAEEKYGHAEFGWGGGMEHQTMSFVGTFNYEILAHELAHQWFGDKVTCGSWNDIWLNEGFATYLSALTYENLQPQYWYPFKRARHDYVVSQPGGSLRCSDTTSVGRIFDGRLSYAKGAMVLHMLRWVCGDSAFFAGVNAYLHDPAIAYGSALTPQLQAHLEAASGLDLTTFLADWYVGEGYPIYDLEWSQEGAGPVHVVLGQSTSHPSVGFFALPVPIRFKNADHDTTVVFQHTANGQTFDVDLSFAADSALIDPELWLLSGANIVTRVQALAAPSDLELFPNPVSDQLTIRRPVATNTALRVRDAIGRTVIERSVAGVLVQLDVQQLAPGTYVLDVDDGTAGWRARFVKR